MCLIWQRMINKFMKYTSKFVLVDRKKAQSPNVLTTALI